MQRVLVRVVACGITPWQAAHLRLPLHQKFAACITHHPTHPAVFRAILVLRFQPAFGLLTHTRRREHIDGHRIELIPALVRGPRR
jgi:hypothetical protein